MKLRHLSIWIPSEVHTLMLQSALEYYKITTEDLFSNISSCEPSRKRGMLYYLTKNECEKTETEIAEIYGVSRQSVQKGIRKIEYGVAKNIWLQNRCDIDAIKHIFSNLLKEQKSWLEKLSQSNNTTHSTQQ